MKKRLKDGEVRVIKVGQTVICQALREFFIDNAEKFMDLELSADDCLHISISPEISEITFYAYRDPECDLLITDKINQYIDEHITLTTDTLYTDEDKTRMYRVFQKEQCL